MEPQPVLASRREDGHKVDLLSTSAESATQRMRGSAKKPNRWWLPFHRRRNARRRLHVPSGRVNKKLVATRSSACRSRLCAATGKRSPPGEEVRQTAETGLLGATRFGRGTAACRSICGRGEEACRVMAPVALGADGRVITTRQRR